MKARILVSPRKVSRPFEVLLALATSLMVGLGCAPEKAKNSGPLSDAYRLMDLHQNARAAAFLENYLESNPQSSEAKTLLASADLGLCNVDVYTIHSQFKELLFDTPLSDRFNGGAPVVNASPSDASTPSTAGELPPQLVVDTPVSDSIKSLEGVLMDLKSVASFLNRFPSVDENKWPLLEQAMSLLDSAGQERDLRLYRVFVRTIYMKSFVSKRILSDPRFGTHDWICNINFDSFDRDLEWLGGLLDRSVEDLSSALKNPSPTLKEVQNRVHKALSDFASDHAQTSAPVSTNGVAASPLRTRIRSASKCH